MEQNNLRRQIIFLSIIIIVGFAGSYYFLKKNKPTVGPQTNAPEVKQDSIPLVSLLNSTFNFENEASASSEKAASGKNSIKLIPQVEYGFNVSQQIKDIPDYQNVKQIKVELKCWAANALSAVYVLSIDDAAGKNLLWDGKPITCDKNENWCTLHYAFDIKPELLQAGNTIKLYPWNKAKEVFFIDDISVQYMGVDKSGTATSNTTSTTNFFYDFEKPDGLSGTESIKQTTAHSGTMACDLTEGKEYGPLVIKTVSQVSNSTLKKIGASVWIYPLTDKTNAVLTVSITNAKGENILWDGKGTEKMPFPKNKWTKLNAVFGIPSEKISLSDRIQVNVWNKGRTDLIVDDMEIVYGENSDRRGEVSTIDVNSIYEKQFVPQKNKPPFKTIYFEKQNINCSAFNEFTSNETYVVLHSPPNKNTLEQLVRIKDGVGEVYSYIPETKSFKKVSSRSMSVDSLVKSNKEMSLDKSFFKPTDITFSGDYYGDNKMEVLKYNTDWRFDLKLMEKEKESYTILGNVDFKGFSNDYNPKYYEFTKLVSGRFINANKTSLLVISCNCVDEKFDGKHCTKFENMPVLPNSVGIYSIERK